jgi:hypothetical protein
MIALVSDLFNTGGSFEVIGSRCSWDQGQRYGDSEDDEAAVLLQTTVTKKSWCTDNHKTFLWNLNTHR